MLIHFLFVLSIFSLNITIETNSSNILVGKAIGSPEFSAFGSDFVPLKLNEVDEVRFSQEEGRTVGEIVFINGDHLHATLNTTALRVGTCEFGVLRVPESAFLRRITVDPSGTSCVPRGGWVPLLRNATYSGTEQSATGYAPLCTGQFSKVKAVYRSGGITCNRNCCPESDFKWNMCNPHDPAGFREDIWSFELLLNGQYLVQQPSWHQLDGDCAVPSSPSGDIVCQKNFEIKREDKLTPTWFEASRQTSLSDNDGRIYVDLFGYTQ